MERSMKRAITTLLLTIGVLLMTSAFVMGAIAIWSTPPLRTHLGNTAGLFGVTGGLLTVVTLIAVYG